MKFRYALLSLVALILMASLAHAAPKWKEVKDNFEEKIESSEADERIAALESVRGINDRLMVKAVAKAMETETDDAVINAARETLNSISDPKIYREVTKYAKSGIQFYGVRGSFVASVSSNRSEDVVKDFLKLLKNSNAQVITWATEAIVSLPDSGPVFEKVKDNLTHKVREVRIASVYALDRCEDPDKGMETLINALDGADGRIKQDINVVLKKKLGAEGYDSPDMWRNELAKWRNKQAGRPADANETMFEEPEVPTFFRVPILSNNVIFVIDHTHSMSFPVDTRIKEEMKKKEENVVESGGEEGKEKEEDPNDDLPWDKINTKWDLAREECKRAIQSLPEDIFFNVIHYQATFTALEGKLVPATQANKDKMCRALDGLTAENVTDAFFDALREGLKYTRSGKQEPLEGPDGKMTYSGLTDHPMKESADVIMFLTDGFPTHGGDGTDMPRDMAEENLERFLTKDWPAKKPVVNAIGIGPHARWLMSRLAKETGGTYVDLSFAGPVRR